jgi:hypothetical protein
MDGKLITASRGPQIVHGGSLLEIGAFSFSFQDNPFVNHSWFEDPKGMVERLEWGFPSLVEGVPLDLLPERVRAELSERGAFSWDNAYLRHYEQVFASLWGKSLILWVDTTFRSKNEIRRDIGSLNRIRNVLFHPSRKPLSDHDREKLSSLFLRFVRGAAGWPQGNGWCFGSSPKPYEAG